MQPPPMPGAFGGGPGSPTDPGAPVGWSAPSEMPVGLGVPGAPGLQFGGVLPRFVAYLLDTILVGIASGLLGGIVGATAGGGSTSAAIGAVLDMGLGLAYFFWLWTGEGRATLGMRLMKLQIGNAFDGRVMTPEQVVRRWAALGLPVQALAVLPGAAGLGGLVGLWQLVLLITTSISPTRQGLHDRFAGTAIVQPAGASTPAFTCLVILVIAFVGIPVLAILLLILLGTEVSSILSTVGGSV